MKTARALIAVVACSLSLSVPAFADGWTTLAGFNDTVELKAGEMAFIVSVSERMTIQYTKLNKRPVQFALATERGRSQRLHYTTSRKAVAPSTANPFPLVGPATITTKTPGVVSMKVTKTEKK